MEESKNTFSRRQFVELLGVSAAGFGLVSMAGCSSGGDASAPAASGGDTTGGGAADAIPFRRAFEQGCDRVVVVLSKTRSYVRRPEKLQPVIERTYREYPNFCRAMARRAEQYNTCRERLFQLEREGRVLVLAPVSTHKVSRIERDTKKLRMLWGDGYQQAVDRMDEIRAFLTPDRA